MRNQLKDGRRDFANKLSPALNDGSGAKNNLLIITNQTDFVNNPLKAEP